MAETIFGKIVSGEIPCRKAHEDEHVVAFHDISPQAPTHVLIVPRVPIETLDDLGPEHAQLVAHMVLTATRLARSLGLAEDGYRLVWNCRGQGGQTVYHLHLHLLGGRELGWPPG